MSAAIKTAPKPTLVDLKMDIRQMAADMVKKDGEIDQGDVKDLLRRATAGGKLDHKCATDLKFVRERYKDSFTAEALSILSFVMAPFVEEEMKRMKEEQRRSKIDKQILAIEERITHLKLDQKLRDLEVDTKQRFMITNLFGQQKRT